MAKPLIGEILLEDGIITQGQLNNVLEIQKIEGGFVGTILVHQNIISDQTLIKYLAIQAEKWLPDI